MDQLCTDITFQLSNYYCLYKEKVTKVLLALNKSDYIASGCSSDVFFYKDGCIKVATYSIPKQNILMLEELRKITHPNLYKIRNFYYSSRDELAYVKAYDMDYYEPEDIDILTMPMDYLLDNMSDLCKLANEMVLHSILITDTHEGNVILKKNRMILIDADRWVIDNGQFNLDYLKADNNRALVHLLFRLYYSALINSGKMAKNSYYPSGNGYNKVLRQLECTTIEDVLKEHQIFKYPIDYIEAKVKKLR